MELEVEEKQNTLFDLSGEKFNINWVDEKQPLFIANNPLHWKAHKLQVLITRLDKQAQNNPAQFNSKNYIMAVNELKIVMEEIKGVKTDEVLESPGLGADRDAGAAQTVGEGNTVGMGFGVSADNPITR